MGTTVDGVATSGAGFVAAARVDRALLSLAPEEFIEQVIVKVFAPRHVVEGRNFFFGLARSGNVRTLQDAGDSNGFAVEVIEPEQLDLPEGLVRVSSTLIRRLIGEGRVEDAARCLGRAFTLFGDVVSGQGCGRALKFPTANIDCGDQITPADGVYAGKAVARGEEYPAAVSIGVKPTLGVHERTIEAHLVGAEGSLYGRRIAVRLLKRLRDQERFDSVEALKAQIAKDVQHVRQLCE